MSCHAEGDIGPMPLDTYDDVVAWRDVLPGVLEAATMPPWPPDDACAELDGRRALPDPELTTLLSWLEHDAPEGDATQATELPAPAVFAADLELPMLEAYTPKEQTDDYRCFPLQWPGDQANFVTAFEVVPGRRELVHHVIAFLIGPSGAAEVDADDEAEAGPGYTCFGTPGTATSLTSLGAWVPGVNGVELPEGTGIRVDPGSRIVLQVHYNTLVTDAAPDLTTLRVRLEDQVDRPAQVLGLLDFGWLLPGGMPIPAGALGVTHETEVSGALLGAMATEIDPSALEPLTIHRVGLHMHQLGREARLDLVGADEQRDCLLHVPHWDFGWQGAYTLTEPVRVGPDDALALSCTWDNDQVNATDVAWGEGTGDEMCLGSVYVTAGSP